MARHTITVEPVTTEDDRQVLTQLWLSASVESGLSPEVASRRASQGSIQQGLERPGVHGFLARLDGRAVGYLVVTECLMRFAEGDELVIEQIYVAPEVRKVGVARSLLQTATGLAERLGIDRIAGAVPSAAREANRFFARLGFSPVVTRRVASVSAVRRRVAPVEAGSPRDRLLHLRRSMRARAKDTPQVEGQVAAGSTVAGGS